MSDWLNNRVQILNPDLTFNSSIASDRQFAPNDVAFDSVGNIYAADSGNNCVKVFNSEGKFLREFGKKGGGSIELKTPQESALTAVTQYTWSKIVTIMFQCSHMREHF